MRLPAWASPLNRRIARLERELLACLAELWPADLDGLIPHGLMSPRDAADPGQPYIDASIRRLLTRWPEDELGALAADMYFSPGSWQPPYSEVARVPTPAGLLGVEPAPDRQLAHLLLDGALNQLGDAQALVEQPQGDRRQVGRLRALADHTAAHFHRQFGHGRPPFRSVAPGSVRIARYRFYGLPRAHVSRAVTGQVHLDYTERMFCMQGAETGPGDSGVSRARTRSDRPIPAPVAGSSSRRRPRARR